MENVFFSECKLQGEDSYCAVFCIFFYPTKKIKLDFESGVLY